MYERVIWDFFLDKSHSINWLIPLSGATVNKKTDEAMLNKIFSDFQNQTYSYCKDIFKTKTIFHEREKIFSKEGSF
jgi:hypothetical protein